MMIQLRPGQHPARQPCHGCQPRRREPRLRDRPSPEARRAGKV